MPRVHEVVGFAIVALFALGWLWGLAAWMARRGPGEWFWRWLAVVQVVAVLQVLLGIVLLMLGHGRELLHYAYGVFPLVALAIAHGVARSPQYEARPWVPFAWASCFAFGLTLRALMTGLGIG
jgi:hypothetical protein